MRFFINSGPSAFDRFFGAPFLFPYVGNASIRSSGSMVLESEPFFSFFVALIRLSLVGGKHEARFDLAFKLHDAFWGY